ncbi:MAG: HAMP domain-containing sensor histidine kinase [Clostridia bacterium]|nr:HAMP domain-containing sensor histidine kinase [Clostridia bacterium]
MINIISVLLCILILGSTETVLMTNYITRQSEDYLSKNAETIRSMIQGNISADGLSNLINGFARAMGCYIIVFDAQSRVIACSTQSTLVRKPPAFLNGDSTRAVLSGHQNSAIGTLGGIFDETMFTLQMPIKDNAGTTVGAVSMSRPIPEHQKMKYDLIKMLLFSSVIIIVFLLILTYFMASKISVPIRRISESTKEFAKGNFSVRVEEDAVEATVYEIAELAEAFNNMAAELEKSEEIKNAFISDVSHELRTPMTTIGGFVSGILDDTIPQDKQKEYLKIVYDEVNRLSRLVNSFLDITRLQSDKMDLKMTSFDINELIRIVIIGLESKLEERKIEVELNLDSENCYVFGDRDCIMRVVTNLLDNAAKFTYDGGKITVTVTQLQHEVKVSIRNTGCGISENQKQMIFQRFYKADKSRSLNKSGTGIGLYLVKNILSAHGKNITVESVEGQYAEFIFTLDKGKHRRRNGDGEE